MCKGNRVLVACLAVAAGLCLAGSAYALSINEIRMDNTGTDTDEYFELLGAPGQSLAGYTYLVIGDGTGGCGIVECVVPLSAYTIPSDSYLAVCRTAGTLGGYDVTGVTAINFENTDNTTHMLVYNFTGTLNQDLDTNNDGVLDITPWAGLVDAVGIRSLATVDCVTYEYVYATNLVGPDGTAVPAQVYRCGDGWYVGTLSLSGGYDSPGMENPECAVGVEESSWGQLKETYR